MLDQPHSHLFGPLQKGLTGKRFATAADVKQVVTFWLQTLAAMHRFLLGQDTSVGVTVRQILKHQFQTRAVVMCANYSARAMSTWKS